MGEQTLQSSGWRQALAGVSLSRVQSLVATIAGVVSITGALLSVSPLARAFSTGELVATVQDASHHGLQSATVEVLTTDDHIVATLTPDAAGHARKDLKEGPYVVRVTRPGYAPEVRRVQVLPRQTVEVRAALHAVPASSPADRAVNNGLRAVRKAFHF